MIAHNWDRIIEESKLIIGQCSGWESLANALCPRLSYKITRTTLKDGLKRELSVDGGFESVKDKLLGTVDKFTPLALSLLDYLRSVGGDRATDLVSLCDRFDRSPASIKLAVEELRREGYNMVVADDSSVSLPKTLAPTAWKIPVHEYLSDNVFRVGVVSDNQLGNRFSRLDVLHSVYERFKVEGISLVLNCGNMPDGESNLNRHELIVTGMEGQLAYIAENYPKIDGIVTQFITGDCHEGWWAKIGFDVGRHMANTFRELGRSDLQWVGHVEADLQLEPDVPDSILRMAHPGGGTAYALSYTVQKYVESLQGGEKPQVLLVGHFHKYDANYPRNIYAIQVGTTCDQTIWMRKKHIEAHVGAVLLEVRLNRMGGVASVGHWWWPYYDRGYYQVWDYRSHYEKV